MWTIIVENEHYQLSPDDLARIVEHLWAGLEGGAVPAAVRLSTALAREDGVDFPVEFPYYEALAVKRCLEDARPRNKTGSLVVRFDLRFTVCLDFHHVMV